MESKPVLLVDAFADEPLAGVPVPVVPGEASPAQLRAIAGEFGADGAVTLGDGRVQYVTRSDRSGLVGAAVAGWTALFERDLLDGRETLAVVDGETTAEFPVEYDDSRSVRVELPPAEIEAVSLPVERLAPALGASPEAIESVESALPISRVGGFGGTLLVPVGFLEGLSRCSPDRESLASVLGTVDASRLAAFTFDTLSRRADVHARVFLPGATGCERPASGVGVAACGQYLRSKEAFDGDLETLQAECGHFLDRPATVETRLGSPCQVGGRGLTVLETEIAVPEEPDDDIIEV